jgi:hypothetical protein
VYHSLIASARTRSAEEIAAVTPAERAAAMPNFVARVELHRAPQSDYRVLHEQMRARNWATWIQASNGRRYHLPQGSYYSDAHPHRQAALNDAIAAANATGHKSSIVVTEGGSTWEGLLEIRPVNSMRG